MNLDRLLATVSGRRRTAHTRRSRRSTRPKGEGTGYVDLIRSLLRRR